MKKYICAAALLFFSANGAFAFYTESDRYLGGFSVGYSMPKGGEWASQYQEALAFSVNIEKPRDEEHAVGFEMGYDSGHEHSLITNCAPRILYFSAYFKEVKKFGNTDLFATIGIGLYHRWTPAYTDNFTGVRYAKSWSGKPGANFSFGVSYDIGNSLVLSGLLKIHYIRRFVGAPSVFSATNLVPSLMIQKRFE